MWTGILVVGATMAVATLLTLDFGLPGGLIEGDLGLSESRTMAFTVLVLAQLFNVFDSRSDTVTAVSQVFTNPWLWAAVGLLALRSSWQSSTSRFSTRHSTPGHSTWSSG